MKADISCFVSMVNLESTLNYITEIANRYLKGVYI